MFYFNGSFANETTSQSIKFTCPFLRQLIYRTKSSIHPSRRDSSVSVYFHSSSTRFSLEFIHRRLLSKNAREITAVESTHGCQEWL